MGSGGAGGIASGGIATNSGTYANGAPTQSPTEAANYGAYAGAGLILSVSNGTVCQLKGPFKVMNFDFGLGPGLDGGVSLALGENGIYQLSITPPITSVGVGVSTSSLHTNTVVKSNSCECQ